MADADLMPRTTLVAETHAAPDTRQAWITAAATILVATAGVLLLFHELALQVVGTWWRSQVFHHCFMILPLAGYMAWQRRDWALKHQPRADYRFLWLMLPIGFGLLLARFASIYELQQHAVMAMLQVLFLTVLGWPAYRSLGWPLLYLFFLVPSGEFLVPKLQDFTAWFAVGVLHIARVPVWSDGTFITIPNGNFEVAEACAGVRFLIASLAFGALYADVMYRSLSKRLVFMALSAVVPVIANGFRAFGIVYLAHVTGNAAAVEADHIIYGWVFFSFVMLVLMLIGNKFREDDQPYGEDRPVKAPAGPPATARGIAAAALLLALAAAPPAWAHFVQGRAAPAVASALDGLVPGSAWQQVPLKPNAWQPQYPGADVTTRRSFSDGRRRVDLYIAYFTLQAPGKKLIGGDTSLNEDDKWRRLNGGTAKAALADTGLKPIAERYLKGIAYRQIWYLYWIDGAYVTSGIEAKLRQAAAELKGGGRGSAIIAIEAEGDEVGQEAQAALVDFAGSLQPLGPVLRRLAGQN